MIYPISKPNYRCVTGADIDDDHPYGDLDRILMDGNLFPYREPDHSLAQPKQWKKCLRGEDIAYLIERACRANAWSGGMTYGFDGSGRPPAFSPDSAVFSRKVNNSAFSSYNLNLAITGMPHDRTPSGSQRTRYSSSLALPENPDDMLLAGNVPIDIYTRFINPIDSSSIIPTSDLIHPNLDTCAALEKAFDFWRQVNFHSLYGSVGNPDLDTQVQTSETSSKNVAPEDVKGYYTPRSGLGLYHRGEDSSFPEEYCYNCNKLVDGLPICSGATTSHTFGIYVLTINARRAPGFEQQSGTWTLMVQQSDWAVDLATVTHAVNLATGSNPPTVSDMGIGTSQYFSYTALLAPTAIVAVNDLG